MALLSPAQRIFNESLGRVGSGMGGGGGGKIYVHGVYIDLGFALGLIVGFVIWIC